MTTVFLDVDSQVDFLFPAGALYVPGAEKITGAIARLNRHASSHGFPIISTVDAHAENDPEFRIWPPHCIAGTLGQRKPEATLVGQILVEKVVNDAFSNPKLSTLLDELRGERYVVYGVVTEICVKCVVDGLLRRRDGARIEIVTDAVRSLNDAAAGELFAEVVAAGGGLTVSSDIAPL
jgi:nicotinamidase/pyrazinamidase